MVSPPRRATLRTLLWAMVLVAPLACSASGPPGDPGEPLGRTSSAILGSRPSDASQDAVMMLVFSDPAMNRRDICTAALIAPRLVLTARHCVSDTDANVACAVDGTPTNGGAVLSNHEPGMLYVFTGTQRPVLDPKSWKPAGRGVEVLDDGVNNLCNHDLALIVLEQPITGVPLAVLRLDGSVEKNEHLTTVGWGVTSQVDEPPARQQRSGVSVTRVGADATAPVLTPNEFAFDESICLGDSGGPILDESTNAVVGVVSRGGNGTSSSTDLASTCTQAVNLGTKLAPFRDLIMRGFERVGAAPILEPPRADDRGSSGCSVAGRRAGGRKRR